MTFPTDPIPQEEIDRMSKRRKAPMGYVIIAMALFYGALVAWILL